MKIDGFPRFPKVPWVLWEVFATTPKMCVGVVTSSVPVHAECRFGPSFKVDLGQMGRLRKEDANGAQYSRAQKRVRRKKLHH